MLVLGRRKNERIRIEHAGAYIWITVAAVGDVQVKLGFDGPPDAIFLREEVIEGPYTHDAPPTDGHSQSSTGGS